MPDFDSLEAIQKHYAKLIRDSDDPDEQRALGVEQREATADFREAQAARRELDAHRATVAAGLPAGVPETMLHGSTPEEIDASAVEIKKWVETIQAPAGAGEADATMYGKTGGAGGGAPNQRLDDGAEWREDFQKRFNESTRGSATRFSPESQATWNVREGERYTKELLAAHGIDHLAKRSKFPLVREMAQGIDPNTLKQR